MGTHVDGLDDGVGYGVLGTGKAYPAIPPRTFHGTGVRGTNPQGFYGVYGDAATIGVYGSHSGPSGAGVMGESSTGTGQGVNGISTSGDGVHGGSQSGSGVHGESGTGSGVFGSSAASDGVHGESTGVGRSGVAGISNVPGGRGVFGQGASFPSPTPQCYAGFFEGDVQVNGAIHVTQTSTFAGDILLVGGDCAEDFEVSSLDQVEPGTVMVIDNDGTVKPSDRAYDKRVAGVVSGAGGYRPALILDKRQSSAHRVPLGLVGKVFCKVDAQYAGIEVGDMLTTSPTVGCAMKATDVAAAFGAVLGKALKPLSSGVGLVPILVTLQ